MKQQTRPQTLSEQMRDGNLFAEQCPSRDVLKTRHQPLGRLNSGCPARRDTPL